MRLRNIPGAREAIAESPFVIPEERQRELRGHWQDAFSDVSDTPAAAGLPAASDAPAASGMPAAPGLPAVSDAPAASGMPATPGLPAASDAPAASGIPAASNAPASPAPGLLSVEIGMGKGRFITQLAQRHPERRYLGIEKYSSVLVRAVDKCEALALPNLRLLRMEAENLCDVFAPGEIDCIYLNFSDPWPKDRHAKRRLPSRRFLALYREVLAPGGRVEFKTDNRDLFAFALEEAAACGWPLEACTWDLHADPVLSEGNIMTEYEERFSAAGNPIMKLIITPPAAQA